MQYEQLPSDFSWGLPFETSGYWVYFLLDGSGEVVYVGQTTNLFSRLGQHNKDDRKLNIVIAVKVILCRDERQMFLTERFYVDRYQPILNIAGTLTTDQLANRMDDDPVESADDITQKLQTITDTELDLALDDIVSDSEPTIMMSPNDAREVIRAWIDGKVPGEEFNNRDLYEVRLTTGYGRAWGYKVMKEFEQANIITRTNDPIYGVKYRVTDRITLDLRDDLRPVKR